MTDRDRNRFRRDFGPPGGGGGGTGTPTSTNHPGPSDVESGLLGNYNVSDTTLGQSSYDFTYRVFPEDLGNEDNNHYMVININVPTTRQGYGRSAFEIMKENGSIMPNEFSKVDTLRFGDFSKYNNSLKYAGSNGGLGSLPRSTRRIKESIALHMPNGGLVFTEENKYQEIGMTAIGGDLLSDAVDAIAGAIGGDTGKFISKMKDATGSIITKGSQIVGYPLNPRVEVLFATRPQRQWVFEVHMLPKSQTESQTIKEIIQTLRFFKLSKFILQIFIFFKKFLVEIKQSFIFVS